VKVSVSLICAEVEEGAKLALRGTLEALECPPDEEARAGAIANAIRTNAIAVSGMMRFTAIIALSILLCSCC
jgi:hypothetical protein